MDQAVKSKPAIAAGIPMPRIGAALAGGIFAGIVRGKDADHALVLLPEVQSSITWQKAMKWAEDLGASLPTRSEQSILFGNLKDQFPDGGWYWSCEQYAGNEGYAWYQSFYYGNQINVLKDFGYRARAVRRLPLQ